MLPSAPIDASLTPLLAIKSNAFLTFAILWKRVFPRSGLGRCSPEMIWQNISLFPNHKELARFAYLSNFSSVTMEYHRDVALSEMLKELNSKIREHHFTKPKRSSINPGEGGHSKRVTKPFHCHSGGN